jgi:hypothetical protein
MHPVAEINGLLRAEVDEGVRIVEIEHYGQENPRNPQPNKSPSRRYFHVFQINFDEIVKTQKSRHSCESRSPELLELTGFPLSRE